VRLGYSTNSLTDHDWPTALELIAGAGFQSVALTIDHHTLNPFHNTYRGELIRLNRLLEFLKLKLVVETGARYLLNPAAKHEPTLVTADDEAAQVRIDFLYRAIELASETGADCVSLWSGILRDGIPRKEAIGRLAKRLEPVIQYADRHQVTLGFEPEPGMLIATFADFAELEEVLGANRLALTIDIGHIHCIEADSMAACLARWGSRAVNFHIEDMLVGVHEHLPFGEGSIDFGPVFEWFKQSSYSGGVHVELGRHGHQGPVLLERSYRFLAAGLR
jgi:L-ribulose-5-phosphate 3-epimerase